jgi:hypothetical protein
VRQPLEFATIQDRLLTKLNPISAIPLRIGSIVNIPGAYRPTRPDPIAPIMAAPDFSQAMYKSLRDISAELMIPNLNLIQQNTIALLQPNQRFIEAYMVGLNHEMSRELLWRGYLTDQRGTYFRQFWDVSDYVTSEPGLTPEQLAERLKDIKPIHTWPRQADLGDNDNRQFSTSEEALVLVIRSDLLKKYPTAVVYAINAVWPDGGGSRQLGNLEKYPLFHAEIEPDLTFLGFDLTAVEAKGSSNPQDNRPGWFVAIKERSGEPRFGLDVADEPAITPAIKWDDLSWGHLAATQAEFDALNYIDLTEPLHNVNITQNPDNVYWATQAADMAHILYQVPVLIAIHASEMLR